MNPKQTGRIGKKIESGNALIFFQEIFKNLLTTFFQCSIINLSKERKEQTMTKESLLDRMIRIYGFEHEEVVEFAEIMDNMDVQTLETIVKCHETFPERGKED